MKLKLAIATLLAVAAVQPLQAETNPNLTEARTIVKQFASQLKGELQKAMKAGGPVNAVGVCHDKAPAIARSLSEASGWMVGRTSLKIRNTANVPTDWELKVLNDFEAKKAAGADPKALEHAEVVETNGRKEFRYMKAIPTAKVCLNCHGGDNVKPEVVAKLKALYPSDQARGFKEGDIRGAFVLKKAL